MSYPNGHKVTGTWVDEMATMDRAIIAAFDQGYSRAKACDPHGREGNPFGPSSEIYQYHAWNAGWDEGKRE